MDAAPRRAGALEAVRAAVAAALDRGDAAGARRLLADVPADAADDAARAHADELARLRDVRAWPDAWLVAAVRGDPPDVPALDALVARFWKMLHARCELLTGSRDLASDLAQDTWVRVLRARRTLQPHGNVAGLLVTVATNLWRDRQRRARRAGPLAAHRLASLDDAVPTRDGGQGVLADVLPDPDALSLAEQELLKLDVDRALARLSPRSRDVLTARYLDEESAVEIGRRYGRTEQTITAWVRQAIDEIRHFLADSPRTPQARSHHADG
jgi:RNA polymerase sigma-70 factor (ECF subfamily)